MPNLNVRSRSFCFTINNYTARSTPSLAGTGACYLLFGREVGDSGTPHLQGFIHYANARTVRSVIGKLPGAHVEKALGTYSQNRTYCTKGGDFDEFGEPPSDPAEGGEQEKERWTRALQRAKEGKVEEIDADILIRYYSSIKRIRVDFRIKPSAIPEVCGIWVFGVSGCGKSHVVQERYPDHYKKGHNKWWDGYDGEAVAYLDDFGKGDIWLGEFYLKHWADRWPFQSESKGFSQQLRPDKFIVTSQYHINDLWFDRETRDALARRFVVIEKRKDMPIVI